MAEIKAEVASTPISPTAKVTKLSPDQEQERTAQRISDRAWQTQYPQAQPPVSRVNTGLDTPPSIRGKIPRRRTDG